MAFPEIHVLGKVLAHLDAEISHTLFRCLCRFATLSARLHHKGCIHEVAYCLQFKRDISVGVESKHFRVFIKRQLADIVEGFGKSALWWREVSIEL
jgi:hypothetical protein